MGIPRFRLLRLLTPLLLVVLAACTLPSAAPPATPEAPAGSPGPAPTSPPLEASYRSEVGGFALNYPQGWATRETSTTLLLAPSPADLERAAPADGLLIQIDSQPQASPPITTTETLFASSSAGLQQAGFTVGMPATMQVGGSPAQVADLQASNAAGRLLVIVSPTRQVRLLGQATPAGWQQQEGLFTAIVNSLRLFAPVVATPVPPDQATQPALLRQGPPGFVLRLGGSSGERTGRFASARGMAAAPDGTLYLAESSRGVWVFQPDGTLLRTFGKDDLLDAYDIARAENGDLFVADYGRNAIAHFRPDGTLVQRWGGAGDGPEQFGVSSPQRLALGPGGDVFALDVRQQEGNTVSSLVRFQPDGTFVERIALPEGAAPTDIVLDRVGNIYLAESVGGAVLQLNSAGELQARLGESVGQGGVVAGAIDLDRQGNLLVATWNAGVLQLSPLGLLIAQGGTAVASGNLPTAGQFSLPNGIVAGPGGLVWVSDNSGEYSAVTALRLMSNTQAQATAVAQETAAATPIASDGLVRQWASSATASSSYAGYPPERATGAPDVQGCMDSQQAWASADPNGLETLELRFATPVFATAVNIHQNHQPGFVSQVEVQDERGEWTKVYNGTPSLQSTCPFVVQVNFGPTTYRVSAVRLTLDQRSGANWSEVDAVELVGVP